MKPHEKIIAYIGLACLLALAVWGTVERLRGDAARAERDAAVARIAAMESEFSLAVAAATDYREQLNRAGELAGQLGDGLALAVAAASRATDYRRGAQIYIDAIRDVSRGLSTLSDLRAVENCEVPPFADR